MDNTGVGYGDLDVRKIRKTGEKAFVSNIRKHRVKYRGRMGISMAILETAREGVTKSRIMSKAYLSSTQLIHYMSFLEKCDLIRRENGTNLYRLTENGFKFLNASTELDSLLSMNNIRKI
ncbi:MAG: hypothetical protein E6K93_05455 [Thaumarchaeota archaeon]|nr:MAG: hypothetical protein E6K93_05455 [Nitrososphaerota archaeon]